MSIFQEIKTFCHELIVYGYDEGTGLKTIIAIHDTTLGPALGGVRFLDYASEDDALKDVLRLSRAMSLKNAAAGLDFGGGKAVIIGDPVKQKSESLLRAFGRIVNSLNGMYYTAEDMNINEQDMTHIAAVTRFVTGTPNISGNPSPFTARGVYMGMKAGAKMMFGSDSLAGKTVAVQGVGSVGYKLCQYLFLEGAVLKVSDINPYAADRAALDFNAEITDDILTTSCDIFAPCALGAVINPDNVHDLKCAMIAGAANNVLSDEKAGDLLDQRGILYLPDYIINAGGVINCGPEAAGEAYNAEKVKAKVDTIYETVLNILKIARGNGMPSHKAADKYALNIITAKRT